MHSRSAFLIIHRLSTLGNCHIRIDLLERLSNSMPCQRVA